MAGEQDRSSSTSVNQALSFDRAVKSRVKQDDPYSHLLDLVAIAEGNTVLDLGCGTGYIDLFVSC